MGIGLVPLMAAAPASAASNIAPQASVSASSQDAATRQLAAKAIDGSTSGFPSDSTREWATVGGKAGSWLQLTWQQPVTISQVTLFDRPNADDQITSANLVFSDGSKVATGSLTNSGAATRVAIATKTTTSLRLEITAVSRTTLNIGLAEIQVTGDVAQNRAPVADAGTDVAVATGATVTLNGSGSNDPDGNPLTYAWSQAGGPAVTLSSKTVARPTFVAASAGTYTFSLQVSDGKLQSNVDTVTVIVAPNQAPIANAGPDQSVYSGTVVTLDASGSTDPEKSALTFAWSQVGSSPTAVTLGSPTAAKPTFTPTVLGTYTFRVTVSDGQLQSQADVRVVVGEAPPVAANLAQRATVTASSDSPASGQSAAKAIDGVVSGFPADATKEWATNGGKAGSWLLLTWPTPVTVDRVVLYDRPNSDDRITSGTLVFSDGSSVATGALPNSGTALSLPFAARTVTSIRLNITGVASTTLNVGLAEIQVWGFTAPNRAPTANAGPDTTALTGVAVTLDGSGSSDPDGNALTYQWAQKADAAPRVTVSKGTSDKASFTATTPGDYTFTLAVSDGKLTSTDEVTVRVTQNQPPTANAGPDQTTMTRRTITLDGSGSTDPNGAQTLTYSWAQVGQAPVAVTLNNPTTAKPTLTTSTAGVYTFRLTVSDGASQATDDVVITVDQAPNNPPVANAGPAQTVFPGVLVTLDGSASSDPDGDALTYAWVVKSGSGVQLANAATAKPTFTPTANGTYVFTLTVSDGVAKASADVTITVQSAGTLTVANSGSSAVWTANFGPARAGASVALQKLTIVTSTTAEVTTSTWVSVATATANSSGVATFTITDPLEVSHTYRAVASPSSANPLLSDLVTYAAPQPTMTTGLANVYIDTNEGGTVNSKDVWWEGRMSIAPATQAAGTTATPCAASTNLLMRVAGRGNYTWTLDKKPYKVNLDKKADLCGMGSGKKWALVANHYDRSLLRNTTAMKMGQGMSNLAFTPDSVPVNVFVNGSYQGSYTLMETVTIAAGRVQVDELKNNLGGVNDQAPQVTGGYLLEWDFRAGGDHNVTVGDSGTVAINEPEDETDGSGITQAQINYVSTYLNSADVAVFANNFADPTNGWRKYIDENSLIDWYLIQELTKNLDANLYTSCFMYKTRDSVVNGVTVPGKLYFGPIWDFDTSMGDANYPGNQGTTSGWYLRNENSAIGAKMTSETWINRLFADPTFAAKVKARWQQVSPTLAASDSFIAAQSSIIAGSADANFRKWNINERLETEQVIKGSWPAEVSYLRSWLSARIAWMNANI